MPAGMEYCARCPASFYKRIPEQNLCLDCATVDKVETMTIIKCELVECPNDFDKRKHGQRFCSKKCQQRAAYMERKALIEEAKALRSKPNPVETEEEDLLG